jgi:hypothetical protein
VHFILTCNQYLAEHSEGEGKSKGQTQQESLIEIVDQVTAISLSPGDLNNQQRGQLLDIVLRAGDLIQGEKK